MADKKIHDDFKPSDTLRAEQAKAEVGRMSQHQDDKAKQPSGQVGEPGRARSELGEKQNEKQKTPENQPG